MMNYLFRRIKRLFRFNSYTPGPFFSARAGLKPPRLSIKKSIQRRYNWGPYKPVKRESHKIVAKDLRHPNYPIREVYRTPFKERSEAHFQQLCAANKLDPASVRNWYKDKTGIQPEDIFVVHE